MDFTGYKIERKRNPNLHSELHALIQEIRTEFGDTAKRGVGSFGFYLGLCKGIEVKHIRSTFIEVRESNASSRKRLFAWKIKEMKKKKNGIQKDDSENNGG